MRGRRLEHAPAPGIGYLVNSYPVLSETFIRNEIRAVRAAGIRVTVFRIEPPSSRLTDDPKLDPEVVDLFGAETAPLDAFSAHLAVLSRRPGSYLSVLRKGVLVYLKHYLVEPSERRRRALHKRWRRFSRAVCLVHRAPRHHVVHLHAHYAKEPVETAELARRLAGIPYSLAAHAKDLYTTPDNRLTRRLRRARFAVACHPHGAERLRELAPRRGARVLQVPHGLDTEVFHPAAEHRRGRLVLAIGRLTPKKGFEHLLAACARLRSRGCDVRCVVIGSGRCRASLEALRDELGLGDGVELRNSVGHGELPRWYRRAAVFVMPAQVLDDGNRDGIPNVLLEAMACGTPVVASRVSSIPTIVRHGVNGLLVPPKDPASLADAIQHLLEEPQRASELGAAAAESVAHLDYRRTNRPLIEEFRAVTNVTVEERLDRVEARTWRHDGVAALAKNRLGLLPTRDRHAEQIIRSAVAPGIRANAWRPDLDRLVERRLWDEVFKARRVPSLLGDLGIREAGARILDLGSGRGGLSVALAAHGHRTVALDLRYRNSLVTRLRGKRYGFEVAAASGIGENLPFAAQSFDAVACLEVLEHVGDPVALLAEVRRVLRPGGACVLTVINRWSHYDPHYRLWGINYLPRSLANRYIALRRRSKQSYRDLQTLDEMHYYRWTAFTRLAGQLGFEVEDPERPGSRPAAWWHDLKRTLSLGFDTALVVLRPVGGRREPAPRSNAERRPRAVAAR